jgi:uncharacterized membrane protein
MASIISIIVFIGALIYFFYQEEHIKINNTYIRSDPIDRFGLICIGIPFITFICTFLWFIIIPIVIIVFPCRYIGKQLGKYDIHIDRE